MSCLIKSSVTFIFCKIKFKKNTKKMRFSVVPMVLLLVVVEFCSVETCQRSQDYCDLCTDHISCPVSTQIRLFGVLYLFAFEFHDQATDTPDECLEKKSFNIVTLTSADQDLFVKSMNDKRQLVASGQTKLDPADEMATVVNAPTKLMRTRLFNDFVSIQSRRGHVNWSMWPGIIRKIVYSDTILAEISTEITTLDRTFGTGPRLVDITRMRKLLKWQLVLGTVK